MNDKQRINFLAELIKLPTASFHHNDDDAIEELGGPPVGFTIRVEESCRSAVSVTAPTLRRALDKAKREMDKPDDE